MSISEKTKMAVEKSIEVNVPIEVAYNQWTQFESFPKFMNGVKQIELTDKNHMHWIVSIAGVKREFDAEITEQVPNDRIAWHSIDGKTHAGMVSFESIGQDITRVNVAFDWKPENIADYAGKILQLDDIQVNQDLKNFKELVESDEFAVDMNDGMGISDNVILSEPGANIQANEKRSGLFTEADRELKNR